MHLEVEDSERREEEEEDVDNKADGGYGHCELAHAIILFRDELLRPGFVASWSCQNKLRYGDSEVEGSRKRRANVNRDTEPFQRLEYL